MFRYARFSATDTKRLMYVSVFVILSLVAALMATTIFVMRNADHRIQAVVLKYNEKSELFVAMRTNARERTISMGKMLMLNDPFGVIDEMDNFNKFGSDFVKARFELRELDLTKEEQLLLNKLYVLVRKNVPIQREVIELILAEEYDVAHHRLLNESIPLQDEIFKFLTKIIYLQEQAANKKIIEGKREQRQAIFILVVLSLITCFIIYVVSIRVVRHITISEKIISEEKERAETTLHSIGDAVVTTDKSGNVEQINNAAEKMLHVHKEDLVGKKLGEYVSFVSESNLQTFYDPVNEVLQGKHVVASSGDAILVTRNEKKYGVEFIASPIYDRNRKLTGSVLVIKDVSRIRTLSSELVYHAKHDNLTGLLNRREIESLLKYTLDECRNNSNECASLCFLDLDQFKIINDTCGHAAGDEWLKQVSQILVEMTRETDYVSRMGGDEFVLILSHCNEENSYQTMSRVLERLEAQNFYWDNKCFNTTASIGIVPIRQDAGSVQDLLSAADTACYVAKEEGRNQIHLLNGDDDKATRKKGEMEWVHRIRQAISDERFILYFQTIKSLPDGNDSLHGEILLRLLGEGDTLIPPFSFIPAAERYNLMPDVDKYVINHTFETLNLFSQYPEVYDGLFSINLSAQSLCEKGFLDFILTQLANFKLAPQNICFEITETAMISNMSKAVGLINSLKERGCMFALDDFGSGLSSFSYLKNLPVDYLKIDGGFVKNINSDKLDYAMVSSMNQIGDILGIETIAEFVEDQAIEETLVSIGINHGQGYGIDMPKPFDDVLEDTVKSLGEVRNLNK